MSRTIKRAAARKRQPRKLQGHGKQRPQAHHKGHQEKNKRSLKPKTKYAAKKARRS